MQINTLAHHGIKGQKHGVRRFQNLDGSLTPEGRIRYGYGDRNITIKSIKAKVSNTASKTASGIKTMASKTSSKMADIKKKRADAKAEKAMKEEEAKKSKEEEKKSKEKEELNQIKRSGNADLVYKNRHRLTDQEFKDAINRIKLDRELDTIRTQQNFDKAQKFIDSVDTTTKMIKSLNDSYGRVTKILDDRRKNTESAEKERLKTTDDWNEIYNNREKLNKKDFDDIIARNKHITKVKENADKAKAEAEAQRKAKKDARKQKISKLKSKLHK